MHELVTARQTSRWQQILELFNLKDIFYSREYILSALKLDPGEALLFYYLDDTGEGEVVYPFIKRRLMAENLLTSDITTPFGYGGPVFKVKGDGGRLAAGFLTAFSVFCRTEKIIAEYIRFHPLLHNAEFLKDKLKLIPVSDTVTLLLNHSRNGKKLVTPIDRKPKYAVKKLGTVKHMFDFLVLYYSSFRKDEEKDSYYFFTNDYFEALVSSLGPDLHLFGAYKEEELLAACYVLAKGDVIYHHLSGKLMHEDAVEAEAELQEAIAEWGADNNFRSFHLAGSQPAASGIKEASISTYFIARVVHDPEICNAFYPIEEQELKKRYGNV
ncbi:GNAT family N-acetyltransferase [Planococcus sp. CAU13]|uniref:GNAT family N-acetyltransferase n=1 Tax=Planococcus sp. CAU13 TaxID=1541197 RepID=UPI00052FDDF7|nr:GNAT family N-acetyltransferase [Planococcus sp. CAU13]